MIYCSQLEKIYTLVAGGNPMHCSECKREIKGNSKFCPFCGAKQYQNFARNTEINHGNLKKIYVALGIIIVLIVAFFMFRTSSSDLEKASIPLVDQILQQQYDLTQSCNGVTITDDLGNNKYLAKAELDDGSVININIEYYPKKDKIYVQVPYNEVLFLN